MFTHIAVASRRAATPPFVHAFSAAIAACGLADVATAQSGGGGFDAADAVQWRTEDGGNGHWYELYVHSGMVSYLEVFAIAQSRGGHCVTLSGSAEAQFVCTLIPDTPSLPATVLLGAHKFNGAWSWLTGEPWQYTNWGGQGCPTGPYPNNGSAGQQIKMPDCPDNWSEPELHWDDYINEGSQVTVIEWSADCNGDGIVDFGQILDGSLADANSNGVPDCCDQGGSCTPCPGDLTGDGLVNGVDLGILLAYWSMPEGDVTGDGTTDGNDLLTVLAAYGGSCP